MKSSKNFHEYLNNKKAMGKNIIIALVILLTFSSCQEQSKIAFVDNGEVIDDYQMKVDIEDRFKLKDEAFKKRMDSIGQAFQIEAQAFQMAADKFSKKQQQEKYDALGQKQRTLQQQFQYEQQLMQQEFSKEMDSVISKVNDFVEDYGKKNSYTFIFGKNQAGSVMYGEDAKDITEAVTKAINLDYGKKDDDTKEKDVTKNASEEEATKE